MAVIAARTRKLSPVAHAIDDGGAFCGARPRAGRWTMSTHVPINCPSCLLVMSAERYSFCETPMASSMSKWHIRRLGPDGLHKGGVGHALTLCNKVVGWDIMVLENFDAGDETVCASCRVLFRGKSKRELGLTRTNAVR